MIFVLLLASQFSFAESACRNLIFSRPKDVGKALVNHTINKITVLNYELCGHSCFKNLDCVSYNVGPSSNPGLQLCELNNADRFQYPQDFKDRQGFSYTGAQNPCASSPCLNNGTCQVGFGDKGYICLCSPKYTGERCKINSDFEWIQANSAPVCIGTKDDAFGSFTAPETGKVQFIKLIHLSGGVAWGGGEYYQGNWGDTADEMFEIHITSANRNKRVAPPAEDYGWQYSLDGQDFNGKTLVFPAFDPYLQVTKGKLFKVWYAYDLNDEEEDDNSGTVCVNVTLLYGFIP